MIQIAIDGHSGSGKSVLAQKLADSLGFSRLDTGAIYRGLACEYKARGLGKPDEKTIAQFVEDIDVKIVFEGKIQHVVVNGVDYTRNLRTEEISSFTSTISPFPKLREKVLHVQRDFAAKNNVVMEGRDIGSTVLPNANVKIFLTADIQTRAKRRYDELADKSNTTLEDVLKDLEERDYRDSTRKTAPLKVAEDAVVLDNTNLTIEQTVEKACHIINEKLQK